jgi:hypothetical protein
VDVASPEKLIGQDAALFHGFFESGVPLQRTIGLIDRIACLAEGTTHAAQQHAPEEFSAAGIFERGADFAQKCVRHIQHAVDSVGQAFHLDGTVAMQHPRFQVAMRRALARIRRLCQQHAVLLEFRCRGVGGFPCLSRAVFVA